MSIEVVKKDAMTFTGYIKKIKAGENKGNITVRNYWQEIFQKELYNGLYEQSDELNVVGIRFGYDPRDGSFNYMVGVRGNGVSIPNTEVVFFPENLYATKKNIGSMPDGIENGIKETHKWLSTSDYRHAGSAEIEIYTEGDTRSEDYISYFWMSVIKK